MVNILGLTLGFSGLLIVLLYYNDEQNYNKSNTEKDKIYRVVHKTVKSGTWSLSNLIEGVKYKEEIPEITDQYLSSNWYSNILIKVNGKDQFTEDILEGAPNFFDFFPFKIIEGTTNKFKEARNYLAISQEQATLLFGNKSAIGKVLEFSERTFIITTVYKIEGKHFFMPNFVIQYRKQPENKNWGNYRANLFVKKTKESNVADIEEKALAIWYKNYVLPTSKKNGVSPEEFVKERGVTPILESINDIRLKSIADNIGGAGPEGAGDYQLIVLMLSLSILLIIISCVNFINLSIVSAVQRAKEVGIKKTLGLSKISLIKQYALEIVLLGIIAFLFSLLILELLLPYFNEFTNKNISLFNFNLFVKIALLALSISVFIGCIPAIYLSKFKAVEVLKGDISRSRKGVFIRNLMLGIQFLISGFFLLGSIIINQQINYMMNKELGFNGDQVIVANMNDGNNPYKKYLLAKKEMVKHPNIDAVTSNSSVIGGFLTDMTAVTFKDITLQPVSINTIDYNFLNVMDIKILKGRNYKEDLASDTINNIIVNETLARRLNIYDDPIGKEINIPTGLTTKVSKNIIGMVKDYNLQGFETKIFPTIYRHWNSDDFARRMFSSIQFKIKPNNIEKTLSYIKSYWSENIEQGYPFSTSFINERFARTYQKYQKQQTLFLVLSLLVIIISLLGLFALATLTIQQRLKEVAIRKTLGASVKEIMFQLLQNFLKIVIISSVILIPIAYYFMQNWLENFVYRIDMPLLPYIITPIILIVLVFAVVGLKAYKATKIDLIKYLKFE
ncbi:ABC transporter permease [Polaribacter ponticola]|uniref:ABC transporter permease n=1 Tax=Polaribacter ponticola TaxID=2978475 RepID=A0ABT5SCU6_9FLAO|nr:ABC transporter permease [Polaribacter sp. MSW5]MDD7915955.1 ABC transporter permease [Polaribacter sp. MSW5]